MAAMSELKPFHVLLAAAGGLFLAQPVAAKGGSAYVGIETGGIIARDNDIDEPASYTASQVPGTPIGLPPPASLEFDDVFSMKYRRPGFDLGLLGGYDFGRFRLELELGYKRVGLGNIGPDDITSQFLTTINAQLNRPSASPEPAGPGLPALAIEDFGLDGNLRVKSAMVNGLFDVDVTDRWTIFAGGGAGASIVKALGSSDSALSWQYLVGARYKIGPRVELGLKHRYFNSGIVTLTSDPLSFAGNPRRLSVDGTQINHSVALSLTPQIEGEFRERSLLASLIYSF